MRCSARLFATARVRAPAALGRAPEHRCGHAIASAVLAAVERNVGDLEHTLRELAFTGGDAIQAAQPEARGDLDVLAVLSERGAGHGCAQLARHFQGVCVRGFR